MKSFQALSALMFLVIVGVTAADATDYQIPKNHPVHHHVRSSFPRKVKGASVVNFTYVP